jgi:hypothetical protein
LLDADADRVDLDSWLIKLLLEDLARVSVCRQRGAKWTFADNVARYGGGHAQIVGNRTG